MRVPFSLSLGEGFGVGFRWVVGGGSSGNEGKGDEGGDGGGSGGDLQRNRQVNEQQPFSSSPKSLMSSRTHLQAAFTGDASSRPVRWTLATRR